MSAKKELSMLLVGDVFVSREDPRSVFQHVGGFLRKADVVLGNLEGAMSDSGAPWSKVGSNWKADARQIAAVEAGGFHAMTVANNHIMDFGHEALFETLGQLDRLGIAHTGGGRNLAEAHAPAIVERDGCRIALLGYTAVYIPGWEAGPEHPGLAVMRGKTAYEPQPRFLEGPGRPPIIHSWILAEDKARLAADIAAARKQADIVIATFHWGVSGGFIKLTDYQLDLAHHAVDAGADLVFGHHPHALQGVEFYKERPIFYSLGNFAFVGVGDYEPEAAIVRCGIQDKKIKSVQFIPICSDDKGNPRIYDLKEGRYIVDLVKRRTASSKFKTQFAEDGDAIRVTAA